MASTLYHKSYNPLGATFPSQLRKLATENPDKPAYIFFDVHMNKIILTRKDVWDKSRKFAAILRRHGVKKGDIVCNTLVNSPERVMSVFGTFLAGAVSMHGQLFLADGEDIIHNCRLAKCSVMIVDPGQTKGALGILNGIQHKDEKTGETRYTGLPELKTIVHFRACINCDEEVLKRGLLTLEEEQEMFEETDVTEDDTAIIFGTSGTTGFSKLIARSYKRAMFICGSLADLMGVRDEHSVCFNMNSLGWVGGFPGTYPTHGCTRVLADMSRGLPEKAENLILKILNEIKVDCGFVVPVMISKLISLMRSGAELNNRAMCFALGGSPMTKELLSAIGLITDSLNNIYGMTELSALTVKLYEEGTPFQEYCVGKEIDGVEIKILDTELNEMPAGKPGQMAVRGPSPMEGYLGIPNKTKEWFTEDGLYLSGDAGFKDSKGEIFVLGRQADAISRGVYIHYPVWMETRIKQCPGVENVAVIGVPDPVYHEEICACVIPSKTGNLTVEQLKEFCSGLLLTDAFEEISATIKNFLLFESFPYNPNGKLSRKTLRAQACDRLGVEDNRMKL